MRIGIDARMLGSGFGLARYVQQLVLHLQKIDKENQYVLFLKSDNWDEVGESDNFKKVLADIHWYGWNEQTKMKTVIKKEKVDLMHFPHWNVPLFYNDPFVVTIHDLIMYKFPRPEATTLGPIKFWLKDMIHRLLVNHAVKKAKYVIVTSEFTRQDVHETLGVDLGKMSVTYQAPFESLKSIKSESQKSFIEKIDLNKPYVLYVGAAYPHKNLERLIKAWKLFEEERGDDYQLVLVGKQNYFYDKLQSKIRNLKSAIYLGFVPDDELIQLYVNASLYVFPSMYEGFGIPPLEAQQYDVPVVSSNASCLPEVLGESALYFDPENVEQMAEIIYKGLTDKDARFDLKNNARENLKRFSSIKLAESTLEIYKK
jgi:glycosyltransferase involved in cell wall biosynthesis